METRITLAGTQEEMENLFDNSKNLSVRFYEQKNKDWIVIIRHSEDLKKKINNIVTLEKMIEFDKTLF